MVVEDLTQFLKILTQFADQIDQIAKSGDGARLREHAAEFRSFVESMHQYGPVPRSRTPGIARSPHRSRKPQSIRPPDCNAYSGGSNLLRVAVRHRQFQDGERSLRPPLRRRSVETTWRAPEPASAHTRFRLT